MSNTDDSTPTPSESDLPPIPNLSLNPVPATVPPQQQAQQVSPIRVLPEELRLAVRVYGPLPPATQSVSFADSLRRQAHVFLETTDIELDVAPIQPTDGSTKVYLTFRPKAVQPVPASGDLSIFKSSKRG